MTLIGYLTRTHFAEAAIEDALPEEVGPLARALVLVDNEPGSAAVCTRVQESLNQTTISLARTDHATASWRSNLPDPRRHERHPDRHAHRRGWICGRRAGAARCGTCHCGGANASR